MIDALVSGKLHAAPVERVSANGRPFVTSKLVCATGNGESMFVDAVAFAPDARAALLALDAGDSVAVTGPMSLKVYTDRNGDARPSLSLVAHAVMTPYAVQRKRKAVEASREQRTAAPPVPPHPRGADLDAMDDDL